MQKIIIRGIETKDGVNRQGSYTMTTITGDGDTKFTTFDNNAITLKPGDAIEAEVQVKGKYVNIIAYRKVAETLSTQTTPPKESPQPQNKYSTTTQPISGAENGMILKEIGDNFRTKVFTPATQPDLWNYYKSEIGRVTGAKIN